MVQKVLQPFAPKTPSKNLKKRFSKSFLKSPAKAHAQRSEATQVQKDKIKKT